MFVLYTCALPKIIYMWIDTMLYEKQMGQNWQQTFDVIQFIIKVF